MPDQSGIGVGLGLGRRDIRIDDKLRRHVPFFGHVDAPEMADAVLVLGVLADADVNLVVVDGGSRDKVISRPLTGQLILGVFGIAIEYPDKLAGIGIERVDLAFPAGKNDLLLAIDDGIGRVGPLAMLDELAAIDQAFEKGFLVAFLGNPGELNRW